MLIVQAFETTLATLIVGAEATRLREKSAGAKAASRKMTKTSLHVYGRATASEMRKALAGSLPKPLLEDLDCAIKHRDRLVHRFLREQMFDVPAGAVFREDTLDELDRVATELNGIVGRLMGELQAAIARMEQVGMPELSESARREIENRCLSALTGRVAPPQPQP